MTSITTAPDEISEEQAYEEWFSFIVADETYGLPVLKVREVMSFTELTPVPGAPHEVLGVINVRGVIIPVVAFRRLLNLPSSEITDESRIVIIEHENSVAGFIVDKANTILRFKSEQIDPPLGTGDVDADIIHGIVKVGETLVILLKIQKLFKVQGEVDLY